MTFPLSTLAGIIWDSGAASMRDCQVLVLPGMTYPNSKNHSKIIHKSSSWDRLMFGMSGWETHLREFFLWTVLAVLAEIAPLARQKWNLSPWIQLYIWESILERKLEFKAENRWVCLKSQPMLGIAQNSSAYRYVPCQVLTYSQESKNQKGIRLYLYTWPALASIEANNESIHLQIFVNFPEYLSTIRVSKIHPISIEEWTKTWIIHSNYARSYIINCQLTF